MVPRTACPQHAGKLVVTRYEDLSQWEAASSGSDEPRMLIAITHDGFENATGSDWATIMAALEKGWIVSLLTDDRRFPNTISSLWSSGTFRPMHTT
jgi:hypothetical protein